MEKKNKGFNNGYGLPDNTDTFSEFQKRFKERANKQAEEWYNVYTNPNAIIEKYRKKKTLEDLPI